PPSATNPSTAFTPPEPTDTPPTSPHHPLACRPFPSHPSHRTPAALPSLGGAGSGRTLPGQRTTQGSMVERVHSGKIRDVYLDGDDVVLVASDRVSVYDVVLPTPIPDKGKILTQLSLWWFEQLADVVPNHVVSGTDVPAEWAGRAVRCKRLKMIEVECIARGYLAGLGLREYQATGAVSGVALPAGLVEGSRLPEPIFTPTTKAAPGSGVHDEFMTFKQVKGQVGAELAADQRYVDVYERLTGVRWR